MCARTLFLTSSSATILIFNMSLPLTSSPKFLPSLSKGPLPCVHETVSACEVSWLISECLERSEGFFEVQPCQHQQTSNSALLAMPDTNAERSSTSLRRRRRFQGQAVVNSTAKDRANDSLKHSVSLSADVSTTPQLPPNKSLSVK